MVPFFSGVLMPLSRASLLSRFLTTGHLAASLAFAHDPITTPLTWNREISRVFQHRCMNCHCPGGGAFSLTSFSDVRPWAVAVREAVGARSMPPWNAVKGFGEFRDENSLTQEEIGLITGWVNGGAPEGDPKDAAALPASRGPRNSEPAARALPVQRVTSLSAPATLIGVRIRSLPPDGETRLVLQQPGADLIPLIWIRGAARGAPTNYYFRTPVRTVRGARILSWTPASQSLPRLEILIRLAPSSSHGPFRGHSPVAE